MRYRLIEIAAALTYVFVLGVLMGLTIADF